MKFLIKPFSEIMIKSKAVRKRYLNRLQTNIQFGIRQIGLNFKVGVFYDKLELNYDGELDTIKISNIKKILSRTPGIESFLEVESFYLPSHPVYESEDFKNYDKQGFEQEIFDFIFQKAKDFYLDKIENKSFVVRVKRSGNHDFRSIDIEKYVGGGLLKYSKNSKVKLKNPDITVNIEIKGDDLYIVKDSLHGIGGYPVGTQDKVLSLISGGFDSGVSTFQLMKRGAKVDFLFFNLGGSAHELGVKQVSSYLNKNFSAGYEANFITIAFEDVVKEIILKIDSKYRAIVLKRLFLIVASNLASQNDYYAIVKGDSLGQVSSQTLKNMSVIDKASHTLVLRPLISFNKQEIIDISKHIGTYDFACNMPEYCGVVSDKPATGAKLEKILLEEEKFDFTLLDRAIENKKVEKVSSMLKDIDDSGEIEISYVPGEKEVVIDIREEASVKKDPLKLDNVKIINIPFFDINHKFKDLDMAKTYLLYCEKGVLSRLHGLYLKEKGFDNLKVYRALEKGCELK